MKRVFLSVLFVLFILPVLVFAGNTDSLGVVGSILVDAISQIPVVGQGAVIIYGLIVWVIVRGAQVVFARIPTKWGRLGPSIGWRILAFLFGRDIMLHNAKPDPVDEKTAQEKIKEKLVKEYPVLKSPWE